jgi:RNase P/RNase MRP subunit p29
MKSNLYDFTARVIAETPKAVLIDHGGKEQVWLPKSLIEIEKNTDGKTVTITCEERLAEEKGIV